MAIQTISMKKEFNAPLDEIFSTLSDHESFGRIVGINMRCIQKGEDGGNGLGSVRSLKMGVLPSFQETITKFIPNEFIEYKITQGSPIKNHVGRMWFSEEDGKTKLDYKIELESKIPFMTGVLKAAVENGLSKGLSRYANTL